MLHNQLSNSLCALFLLTLISACEEEASTQVGAGGQSLPPLGNTSAPEGGGGASGAGGEAGPQAGSPAAGTLGPVGGAPPSAGALEAGEEAGAVASGGALGGEGGSQAGVTPGELGPARDCSVTIYASSETEEPTFFASSVTGWGDAPVEMSYAGRDEEGRARYELSLSAREGLGLTLGLEEGTRYPYKLIQGGAWRLNEEASLQAFEGSCTNSAFVIPSCEEPALELEPLSPEWSAGAGSLTVRGRALRGSGLGSAISAIEASIDGAPLTLDFDAQSGAFNATLNGLSQGKHRVTLQVTDLSGRQSELITAPFWVEEVAFDWGKTPLYMVLVDRFANGQPSSDAPVGPPVAPIADWRGGDLQGVTEAIRAGYFDQLGVRAIWLSPINEQVDGHFEDRAGEGRRFAAYHGYWPISGRRIDARYGGDEGLRELVTAAHERGIRVLLDLINNQVHERHEYYTQNPDWFRTSCVCGAEAGCGWSERPLDCLFASYLPDINWRDPGAEAQFIADALYWVEEFDVDGFRVDAVKHVETTSIYNLREALSRRFERGGERVWMLGETAVGEGDRFDDGCGVRYESGYEWIDAYTSPKGLDGQFDFPTHHRTRWQLLSPSGDLGAVAEAYEDAVNRYRADATHVRFLGSHDTPRISSESAGDLSAPCVWPEQVDCDQPAGQIEDEEVIARLKRAWATLYLSPGTPLLYYGDELALPGAADPDNRRVMPWEGALESLNIGSPVGLSTQQRSLRTWLESLGQLRARSDAVARGELVTLWRSPELYVFARLDPEGRGVVVALNRGEQSSQTMSAPRAWSNLTEQLSRALSASPLGAQEGALTLSGGLMTFSLGRGEVAVFERP